MVESFKFVSWDSIVLLGINLSNDCRLGGRYSDSRTTHAEAFLRARRCPMSLASFGGREFDGTASPFPYLQAAVAHAQWADTVAEELSLLRHGETDEMNDAQWLESILAWAKDDFQLLKWISATSGASLTLMPRTGGEGFVATFTEGHKPSNYKKLFVNMHDRALTNEEIDLLVEPTSQEV